jgi:hypothetical protein
MPLWHVQNVGFHLAARRARELGLGTLLCGDTFGMMSSLAKYLPWRRLMPMTRLTRQLPGSAETLVHELSNALAGLPFVAHGFHWAQPLLLQLVDGYGRSTLERRCEEAFAFMPDAARRRIHGGRLADIQLWHSRFYYRGDRMGNAQGVEYRTPFGDVQSFEFAANVPLDLQMKGGVSKWGLKEVALRYVPRSVAYQKKISWTVPVEIYLRPLATPSLFRGGYCERVFGIASADLGERLRAWQGHELARMVHLEVWGRLFAMGETLDEINRRIAAAGH